MKISVLTIFLSCSLVSGCSDRKLIDLVDPPYFPLEIGDRWTYQHWRDSTRTWTFEIVGTTTIGSHEYRIMRRSYGTSHADSAYFRQESKTRIFTYREGEDVLYIDFRRPVGSQWETYRGFIATILERSVVHETPAGRFKNCIVVYFDYPPTADDEHRHVYAPAVGLIESSGQAGPIRLASAILK